MKGESEQHTVSIDCAGCCFVLVVIPVVAPDPTVSVSDKSHSLEPKCPRLAENLPIGAPWLQSR
jgi:hypothetical protein